MLVNIKKKVKCEKKKKMKQRVMKNGMKNKQGREEGSGSQHAAKRFFISIEHSEISGRSPLQTWVIKAVWFQESNKNRVKTHWVGCL